MPSNIHGLHYALVGKNKIEVYTQVSSDGMTRTAGFNYPTEQDLGGYEGDTIIYQLKQVSGAQNGTVFPGTIVFTWHTAMGNQTSVDGIDLRVHDFTGLNEGETYELRSTNHQGDVKIYRFYTNPDSNYGSYGVGGSQGDVRGVLYAYQPDTNALEVSIWHTHIPSGQRTDLTFTDSTSTIADRPIILSGSTQNFNSLCFAHDPNTYGSAASNTAAFYQCCCDAGTTQGVNGDCSQAPVNGSISLNIYQKHAVDLSGAPDGGEWGWEIPDGSGGTTRAIVEWNQNWGNNFSVSPVSGCTDDTACNYDSNATFDDGSCCYVSGCTNPLATNYNPTACCDDGSCILATATTDCYSIFPFIAITGSASVTQSGQATGSYSPQMNYSESIWNSATCASCLTPCSPSCNTSDWVHDLRYDITIQEWDFALGSAVSGGYFKSASNVSLPENQGQNTYGASNMITSSPSVAWCDDLHEADYKVTCTVVDVNNSGTCTCLHTLPGGTATPWDLLGCTSEQQVNINSQTYGCTDPTASNYNPNAQWDDGSCIYPVYGCTNPLASNYNPLANTDDGSCNVTIWGCTDQDSVNYNPLATDDNGSCVPCVYGCTNIASSNYNPLATCDDGNCAGCNYGCTDSTASNYNSEATCDDGSCCVDGCTDPTAMNYNVLATCMCEGCCEYCVYGCTDPNASNYNSGATCDDGTCLEGECSDCFKLLNVLYKEANCEGCTEEDYLTEKRNLQRFMNLRVMRDLAYECKTQSDIDYIELMKAEEYELCSTLLDEHTNEDVNDYKVYGCTNPNSLNYNPNATHPCEKAGVINYCCGDSSSFKYSGCTDPLANNYSPIANIDDGSCMY